MYRGPGGRLLVIGVLLAGCVTSPGRGPQVTVEAVREEGGIRVAFRRTEPGTMGNPAELVADAGRLAQVVHSPDRLTVSALWREPRGMLRCTFAYGGEAVFRADDPTSARAVHYVFLDEEGVRITCTVPSGRLPRPSLPLVVDLAEHHIPARLSLAGRVIGEISGAGESVLLRLPVDEEGALRGGDIECTVTTAGGRGFTFLLAVDSDGIPAAVSGYVSCW